jgi:uncharacterized OB-fold protein
MEIAALNPVLSPSPEGDPFWAAVAEHRLILPRCDACGRLFFYPRALCPHCGARDLEWVPASGRGTLHSFCMLFHSGAPGLAEALPLTTGLIDLEEGVRVMAYLVGFPENPEQIRCDTPVEVDYVDVAGGGAVLAFRPAVG